MSNKEDMIFSKAVFKEWITTFAKQSPIVILLGFISWLFWTQLDSKTQQLLSKYEKDNTALKIELKEERDQSKSDRKIFREFMQECMKSK